LWPGRRSSIRIRIGTIKAVEDRVQLAQECAYAAAIGTILGACVLLGRIAIGDWLTVLIGLTDVEG